LGRFCPTSAGARLNRSIKKTRLFFLRARQDAIFYINQVKVKLTVLSEQRKEAVVAILDSGDFCGEGCLAAQPRRMATAAAMTECLITRVDKAAMIRALHDEPKFSGKFMAHLLARNIRVEADLVDQLFNSSEKRLARLLLILANFGKDGKPEPVLAKINQDNARGNDRHDAITGQLLHE
jgi:CRP-like cAMP-binding protein